MRYQEKSFTTYGTAVSTSPIVPIHLISVYSSKEKKVPYIFLASTFSWMRLMSRILRLVLGFILLITAILFLLMFSFFCIACSYHTIDSYTGGDNEYPRRRVVSGSSESAAAATCLDDLKIKSCSEVMVLEMNENGSVGQHEKHSCSICLDESGEKEKVRQINLCQHRFHAHCVDHWFQKNITCPICKVSLLDEKV